MIPNQRTDSLKSPVKTLKANVPQHVVYRNLVSETVVLNVETGIYYGLNTTAGRMLEVLDREPDVETALAVLVAEFDAAEATLREDLMALISDLTQNGLLETVEEPLE